MKNVKLDLNRKAGFSLVEMLVVIAIIGIIAAIAIPNIGSINEQARTATAQRNAQSVASVLNAALAAGAELNDPVGGAAIITLAEQGVTPDKGAFAGKKFTVGTLDVDAKAEAAKYLSYDAENDQVIYSTTEIVVE